MNLKLSEIEKEANDKSIIPKKLILVDNDNKVIETIDFDKDKHVSNEWFVQWPMHSYIVYLHQFTSECVEQNIRIDNFLELGFPIRKRKFPEEKKIKN